MIRTLVALLLAAAPLAVAAENLTQVYQDALRYDAQFAAAQEKRGQGSSGSGLHSSQHRSPNGQGTHGSGLGQ